MHRRRRSRSARRERRGPLCCGSRFGQLVEEPHLLHVHGRPRRRRASPSKPRPVFSRRRSCSCAANGRRARASRPSPRRAAAGWTLGASARIRRVVARRASAPLLCLSSVKAGFCLLAGSLELAHPCRAGEPRSIRLGLVQIETLTGVESLGSKIVQMIGGHGFVRRGSVVAGLCARRSFSGGRVSVR